MSLSSKRFAPKLDVGTADRRSLPLLQGFVHSLPEGRAPAQVHSSSSSFLDVFAGSLDGPVLGRFLHLFSNVYHLPLDNHQRIGLESLCPLVDFETAPRPHHHHHLSPSSISPLSHHFPRRCASHQSPANRRLPSSRDFTIILLRSC